jgi:SulP family sulfate permease
LLTTLKSGYTRQHFTADLLAGLLVGVVALPLSMALAIASGCTPEQGLWTTIIGGFLISFFGGSRVQIGGPAGAFVGLCAVGVNQFGYAGLALATLMAGFFILFLGIARLGKAVSYIPMPVVIGFTTGIALILFSTQMSPALGLVDPTKPAEHLHERIIFIVDHINEWNWRAVTCCLLTIVITLFLRRVHQQIPSALIAVLLVTILAHQAGWNASSGDQTQIENSSSFLSTISSRYGDIPHSLPMPTMPSLGLGEHWTLSELFMRLRDLSSLALAIELLGSI